jgi:hypothetical protein
MQPASQDCGDATNPQTPEKKAKQLAENDEQLT